jgi:hypothetical protein
MALPVPPFNPIRPIPNNPFYSPQSFSLQGTIGPITIGSGLNVDYSTNILSATGGGGGGGVTQRRSQQDPVSPFLLAAVRLPLARQVWAQVPSPAYQREQD